MIGWADLTDPGMADTIAALRSAPDGEHLVGIRHQVHDDRIPSGSSETMSSTGSAPWAPPVLPMTS